MQRVSNLFPTPCRHAAFITTEQQPCRKPKLLMCQNGSLETTA